MQSQLYTTRHWLSVRVRLICVAVFIFASLLPPYIPKAALAPQETEIPVPQFLLVEEGFIMKSSSLTKSGSRRAYAEGVDHIVKEGESIEKLANRYGIAADTVRWANDLEGRALQPGQEILILPVDGVLHTVTRGQTLSRISELYSIDQQMIIDQNKLKSTFLLAGQELIVPGAQPIVGKAVVASVDPPPPSEEKDEPKEQPAKIVHRDSPHGFTPSPTVGVLQKPCSSECFNTQYYHARHYALDMQERGGGPIYAAEDGVVIRSDYGWNGGYGNVVEVDHGNGLVTLYAHNKEHYVQEGDLVKRGQTIAWMGNTGLVYGSTGIHVHFEVRLNGVKKNPILYLE